MPPTRRTLLRTAGAVGLAATTGLAGCGALGADTPPASALVLENRHDLPHQVGVEVVDVGTDYEPDTRSVTGDPIVPPALRELRTTAALRPGERLVYPQTFTEPVYYEVALEIDGRPPRTAPVRRVAFTPVPEGADGGQYLGVEVQADGELTWVLSGTPDTSV